ncbi:lysM and putative peptidoglycan-binding domain-containing protein 2-like [Clavelina lepadiformis]|uniref:LysM domain-containing protein n=1 Tax=Clavelina lepadiformis TaxID=159417 RepID=A0ABP0FAC6_CLALP
MSEWESIIGSSKASSYGSCIRSTPKTMQEYVKHYLHKSDTVQGIALKYNISTEELRRINKLYSSDSIFLRTFLLVPAPMTCPASSKNLMNVEVENKTPSAKATEPEELDAFSFLQKLDCKINAGKMAVKDYKFEEDILDRNSRNRTSSTKYFPKKKFHKVEPGTVFSHSQRDDDDHLFQL